MSLLAIISKQNGIQVADLICINLPILLTFNNIEFQPGNNIPG